MALVIALVGFLAAGAIYAVPVLLRPVPDLDEYERAADRIVLPDGFTRVDVERRDYGRCWDPIDCPQSLVRVTWTTTNQTLDCEVLRDAATNAAGRTVNVGGVSSGCKVSYEDDGVTVEAFYGSECAGVRTPRCVYVFAFGNG